MSSSPSSFAAYQRVVVRVNRAAQEALAFHLESLGAAGVEIVNAADPAQVEVVAYYPWVDEQAPGPISMQALCDWVDQLPAYGLDPGRGEGRVQTSRVQARDWAEQWKQYFHPQPVGKHFLVCPSWEIPGPEMEPERLRLILDPGQAFGTGQHPTTQLALEWVEQTLADRGDSQSVQRLFDIGCGSGILALAAYRLGVPRVWAVDIDPMAVATTVHNLSHNGVHAASVQTLEGSWERLRAVTQDPAAGAADLVVANILAEVLIPLASDLGWLLAPTGTFIGSGISQAAWRPVAAALQQAGWSHQEWRQRGEWRAVRARRPRVGLVSLGCKVNQYEADALAEQLRQHGLVPTKADGPQVGPIDAYCLNSCAVTAASEKKSRQWIRRLHQANPRAPVVVMGCFSQAEPHQAAALPGVALVVGTRQRAQIAAWLANRLRLGDPQPLPATGQTVEPRTTPVTCWVTPVYHEHRYEELDYAHVAQTRAVVKVQDGCSHFCSYCLIPHLRGPSRSRNPQQVLAEVERCVEQGFQEVVLTGVHLGGYGQDEGAPGWSLACLVQAVGAVPGLQRLRLSSLDPHEVTAELLAVLRQTPAFCPHLHLPLQSGDDGVLAAMRRRHTAGQMAELAHRLRQLWPEIALTTDVIVGFPGETEAAFERTVDLCRQVGFSRLHVFPFSARRGTPAARFSGQVPLPVRRERVHRLMAVGRELALAYHRRWLRRTVEVLVEEHWPGRAVTGLTREYVRVQLVDGTSGQPAATCRSGERVQAEVVEAEWDGVVGRVRQVEDGVTASEAREALA